ncbi:MAG: aryl-sulfate sulfotransferase [Pseudomonadales bacterium]
MARSEHHPNGLIHYNPQLAYKGYTLFSANAKDAYLIDMDGRFVHRWSCDLGINNPTLLPNGSLIALAMPSETVEGQRGLNGQSAACYELDWDSHITWRYDDPWIHHDYQRLPNENTLLVKWMDMPKSLVSKVKGGYHAEDDDPKAMLGDVVIEVTPDGEIVKEWKSWQHFNPKTEVTGPLYHRKEWSHCNSISLAPNGDWLMSFRKLDSIMQINPKSGKIRWKWGDGVTIASQHDVKYATENTITIFDNGCFRKSGMQFSRALEIDAKTKEVLWEYADDPPFSFFTLMGGSADVLPNNNVLICETSKGQFFEVTRDRKVVWEYINPMFINNPRLGGRMNMVFRAHRYGPDYPGLKDRDLDPQRLANLNRLYCDRF